MEIPNIELNEWISELKPYQSSSINQLLDNNDCDAVVGLWLSANGPDTTIQFGGHSSESSVEPFFERFQEEFRKVICGDEAYSQFRNQLSGEGPLTKGLLISVISSALGATFGFAATIFAPAVAIMLYLVGSMGVNAWCKID